MGNQNIIEKKQHELYNKKKRVTELISKNVRKIGIFVFFSLSAI